MYARITSDYKPVIGDVLCTCSNSTSHYRLEQATDSHYKFDVVRVHDGAAPKGITVGKNATLSYIVSLVPRTPDALFFQDASAWKRARR